MDRTLIRVSRGTDLRGKIPTVVGVMPAETLVRHHDVPQRDVIKDTGYQRPPSDSRISRLATDLSNERVDLPTSVLLSLRVEDLETVLEPEGTDSYRLSLDPAKADDDHKLYVVDGQHRIKAIERAINDGVNLRNFKVPFVIMLGANEAQEMEQFHVVNSNAKSVPTDLAIDLLRSRFEQDPSFARLVEERGDKWKVQGQELTLHLAQSSGTWQGRIRLPNSPKAETTVPSATFVQSLRGLLTNNYIFRRIATTEQRAQLLGAYWWAIARVLPEAFEEPTKYNIQKGVGVEAMHAVLPNLLDPARSHGGSLFNPASYEEPLRNALIGLDGRNGHGETVEGAAFWRTGRDGAAGIYSGAAGRRRLAEMIESRLPLPQL